MERKTLVETRGIIFSSKCLIGAWVFVLNSHVLFEVARRRGTFEEKISKND